MRWIALVVGCLTPSACRTNPPPASRANLAPSASVASSSSSEKKPDLSPANSYPRARETMVSWLVDDTGTTGSRIVYMSTDPVAVVEAYFDARNPRVGERLWRITRSNRVAEIFVSEIASNVVVGDDRRPGEVTRIIVVEWHVGHPVRKPADP